MHGVDVGLPWFVEHGALTAVAATAICAICMYASAGVHPLERTSPWLGILRRRRGGSGSVKVAVGTRGGFQRWSRISSELLSFGSLA